MPLLFFGGGAIQRSLLATKQSSSSMLKIALPRDARYKRYARNDNWQIKFLRPADIAGITIASNCGYAF